MLEIIFAEKMDGTGVRTKKPIGKLEKNAFADPGGAKQNAGLIWLYRKAHVFKHRVMNPIETLRNSRTGPAVAEPSPALARWKKWSRHQPKMVNMIWVTRKSTKMISTDETTTALMVDRPTPSVPPVVLRP